jgi:YD repeat-containing protein
MSKTFVLVSAAPNFTNNGLDERWTIRGRLTSSTNLELFRTENGSAVDAYWQVVEMQGASVQRGIATIPDSTTSVNASITSVDTTKSFLIMNIAADSSANGNEGRYLIRGAFTNSTTLTFNRVGTQGTPTIAWEVVSMSDGTTVQSGAKSTTATSDSTLNQTLSSAVDLARSFVYLSVQGGANGTATDLGEVSWTGSLTSTTNLRLQRGATGSQATINWQAVQFAAGPTNLAVTSVNGGANPTAGSGFSVVVQAQDATGAAKNVLDDTAVQIILKTGTGTLGGTLTGNITAGTSQVTISGVTYTKAESGVVMTAHRTSGDALTDGDSAAFTVNPGGTIAGPPTIAVKDSLGNTVTSSNASITVAIGTNPSSGVLSGTTTKNATSGVASFSDLSIDKAGSGYTLTASSTGLTGATSSAFSITQADLVVTSVSNPPASAVTGGSFSVSDTTANNGNGSAGASTTSYRLSLDNVITSSDTLLTGTRSVPSLGASANSSGSVNVMIPTSLASGTYFLGACADHADVVAESNETNNCLASTGTVVVTAGPNISSLLPASGPIGFSVTINGANFGATQGSSTVTFDGTAATPTSWSGTSIIAPVPAGATTGLVVVTVGGNASNGVTFTVTPAITYIYDELGRLRSVSDPTGDTAVYNYDAVGNLLSIDRHASSAVSVIEFQPKSGPVGATVAIQGTGFSTTLNQNTVTFNGTAASVNSATATQLVVAVPVGATTGFINVTAPGGSGASATAFTVTTATGAPTITSFNPTAGIANTAVAITGTNFDTTASNDIVRFNGAIAGVTSATSTTINTAVPTATGSGKISVTTPHGTVTSSADFFVPPAFAAAAVQFTSRIALGSNVTVNITTPNKIGMVLFDGTAGQWVNVQLGSVTFPDRKSNVSLLKPNGSVLHTDSGVPQAGDSFSAQLPDSGSYALAVSAANGITGGMNVSVSVTTPGTNPLSLACDGSCALSCSDASPSLTFTASGGKPPYNWSTTKGTITPSTADRSKAVLTPPSNSGGAVGGIAYRRFFSWDQTATFCGPTPFGGNTIYGCDGQIIGTQAVAGSPSDFPACNLVDAPLCLLNTDAACRNQDLSLRPAYSSNTAAGLACLGFGGADCDVRSQAMKDSGCAPCGITMIGVEVTVTDANGNKVPMQPLIQ